MTSSGLRAAQAAIDGARAAVERLDDTRGAEDNAADLIEAWEGTQNALRALVGGVAMSDQALIREARQRNVLDWKEANALVDFSAAADRSRSPDYRPNAADLASARAAFQLLEAAIGRSPGTGSASARPQSPPPPPVSVPTDVAPASVTTSSRTGSGWMAKGLVLVALLAIVGAGSYYVLRFRGRGDRTQRGIALYTSGDRVAARLEFTAAVADEPNAAVPHIYLGRIAREEGDAASAGRELNTALTLEPENALALREMGAHLFALGNLDLARRFYVRAVSRDPADKIAQGFLACILARLGRFDEAQRFLQRAGPGEWSACIGAAIPPGASSVVPPTGIPK